MKEAKNEFLKLDKNTFLFHCVNVEKITGIMMKGKHIHIIPTFSVFIETRYLNNLDKKLSCLQTSSCYTKQRYIKTKFIAFTRVYK